MEPLLRELDPTRTLADLQRVVRHAEKRFEDDEGRITPAELVSLSQGTVTGRETNVAAFEPCAAVPLPLELLGEIPTDDFEKEIFFQSLGKRGYELICYSDVLIAGATVEVAVCRLLTEPEPQPPPQPEPAPEPQPEPVPVEEKVATVPVTDAPVVVVPIAEPPPPPIPVTPPVPADPRPPVISIPVEEKPPLTDPSPPVVVAKPQPEVIPPAPAVPPSPPPPPPPEPDRLISQAAFDLIVDFEGLDQPGLWPGAASGISLGVGYDLGYVTAAQFVRDWSPHLTDAHLGRLKTAIGKTSGAARAIAPRFADIRVSRASGMDVFLKRTLPRFSELARKAFPGLERLPANAQGALVSLVFNRGPAMEGKRRREMAAIQRIVKTADLPAKRDEVLASIATQIRAMKRLWDGRKLRGLHRRRDAEAALVLSSREADESSVLAAAAEAVIGTVTAAAGVVLGPTRGATGEALVEIAARHVNIGERYWLGAMVPKNAANWRGPWDCAEFVSWCVFQTAGILYGCENNRANPARADAYTGYWKRDALRLGRIITIEEAVAIPGAVLLRYPPSTGCGHIAFSDGRGGTLEAKCSAEGVVSDVAKGRRWDVGVLIDGFEYQPPDPAVRLTSRPVVYFPGAPKMDKTVIAAIQRKLKEAGCDPGPDEGEFTDQTGAAVLAFQARHGLMVDGEVGRQTAAALGVLI